jgi:hypothetical protein
MLQAFEVVNIKERFLVDVAAAGGGWLEATESSLPLDWLVWIIRQDPEV